MDTKKYIIETTGTGVAIFDYDNDGWPDIFFVNGTTLEGFPKGKRRPIISTTIITTERLPTSPSKPDWPRAVGDRVFASATTTTTAGKISTSLTTGKNRLYHNDHGVFSDVAEQAGVAGSGKVWGTGVRFVDYDRDGQLDLMVANYVDFDLATAPAPGDVLRACGKACR